MSAPDLEVRCALLLCEFKSSGSAEVIHECREDILATRKSAPGTSDVPGRSDYVRWSVKTGSRVSMPSGPFQGRPTLDRQDTRMLLAKWLSPVDLARCRSSATAANTGETP